MMHEKHRIVRTTVEIPCVTANREVPCGMEAEHAIGEAALQLVLCTQLVMSYICSLNISNAPWNRDMECEASPRVMLYRLLRVSQDVEEKVVRSRLAQRGL